MARHSDPAQAKRPGNIADYDATQTGRTGRASTRLIWVCAAFALVTVLLALILGMRTSADSQSKRPNGASAASIAVGASVGERAPDFTLKDLTGKQVSLHSFLGQPVLIHFWAVDCTTCQAEQPDYLRAVHALGSHAPKILAIDAWGETASYVVPFVRKNGIPGIVLIDPDHHVFSSLYLSQGTPTTFYIDKRGVIRQSVIGQESYDQIVANARSISA
jgi:peroxiredoxin